MERALGNIFVRDSHDHAGFKAGEIVKGHAHNFDHVTFCFGGRLLIRATVRGEAVETVVEPGDYRLIKAGIEHEITALDEGARFLCVYAHRTPQGEVVQDYTGWPDAYN